MVDCQLLSFVASSVRRNGAHGAIYRSSLQIFKTSSWVRIIRNPCHVFVLGKISSADIVCRRCATSYSFSSALLNGNALWLLGVVCFLPVYIEILVPDSRAARLIRSSNATEPRRTPTPQVSLRSHPTLLNPVNMCLGRGNPIYHLFMLYRILHQVNGY